MSLLNAPEFNEKKENLRRNVIVGSGIVIAIVAVLTVGGFLLGHGWLFINLPVEHRVSVFLATCEAGDYPKAFGIWNNDPDWQKHPDVYKDYPVKQFTADFSTASDWKGPVKSYKVEFSKRDATGTVVASKVNGSTPLMLKYQRKDGTLAFFPYVLSRGF